MTPLLLAAFFTLPSLTVPPSLTPEEKVRAEFPDAPVMVRIAAAESNFVETAKNPKSSAKGLYQILDGTWRHFKCEGDVLDADDNIQCARTIYSKNGTKDWDASKRGWSRGVGKEE